jgi:two-component system response regulator PrrA
MARRRLLFVDDDEAMRMILSATLPRLAGVEVVTAATGAHALERLAHERFDLVLLDFELPDVDGPRLCARIRDRLGPDVPVVFLSGHGEGPERTAALSAGADAFLSKATPPAGIATRLSALLGMGAGAGADG